MAGDIVFQMGENYIPLIDGLEFRTYSSPGL